MTLSDPWAMVVNGSINGCQKNHVIDDDQKSQRQIVVAQSTKGSPRRFRMARYVDGYVLPVPKKNVKAYRRMAQKAGKIWREHGALDYKECVGDDLNVKGLVPFQRPVKAKPDETVVFAWIVFKSRAHRDRVNAKVMKDPRLADSMDQKLMPFDVKRMVYGGFKVLVDA
jgi:uncharacterized protein YbaA (DUF1428 family)